MFSCEYCNRAPLVAAFVVLTLAVMYKKEKKTCNLKCMKSVSFLWKTISNNQVISKNYFYSSSVSQKRITPKLFSKNARSTEKAKAATVGVLQEKLFFKISRNSQKTPVSESLFLIKLQTLEQVTLAQVFSCEFCEIFKNTFFTEHFWTTASKKGLLEEYLEHCEILMIKLYFTLNRIWRW